MFNMNMCMRTTISISVTVPKSDSVMFVCPLAPAYRRLPENLQSSIIVKMFTDIIVNTAKN